MSLQAKLRWRCRRGMRELDALLLGWLDSEYDNADDESRQLFSELLELQDPDIMRLINSRAVIDSTASDVTYDKLARNSRFERIIQQLRPAQPS